MRRGTSGRSRPVISLPKVRSLAGHRNHRVVGLVPEMGSKRTAGGRRSIMGRPDSILSPVVRRSGVPAGGAPERPRRTAVARVGPGRRPGTSRACVGGAPGWVAASGTPAEWLDGAVVGLARGVSRPVDRLGIFPSRAPGRRLSRRILRGCAASGGIRLRECRPRGYRLRGCDSACVGVTRIGTEVGGCRACRAWRVRPGVACTSSRRACRRRTCASATRFRGWPRRRGRCGAVRCAVSPARVARPRRRRRSGRRPAWARRRRPSRGP